MRFFECMDLVRQRYPHAIIEVDGQPHALLAFAHHADLHMLQAEAQLVWNHVAHPHENEQVGLIEVEPVRKAGQVLNHHKKLIIVRFKPATE